jgi:hypothetical protein
VYIVAQSLYFGCSFLIDAGKNMRDISFSLANASTVLAGTVLQPSRHKHTSFNALSKCQRKGRHKTKLSAKDCLVRALEDTRVQMLVSPPIQKNRGGRRAVCSQGFQTAAMPKIAPPDLSAHRHEREDFQTFVQSASFLTPIKLVKQGGYELMQTAMFCTDGISDSQSLSHRCLGKHLGEGHQVGAYVFAPIALPLNRAIKKPLQ